MTNAAVIIAELVDVRNVGMHKAVKLTLHVPAERAGQVMAAFGWPTAVDPVPVAVARLNDPSATKETPKPAPVSEPKPVRAKQRWDDMSPAQQAGVLCADKAFQRFIGERYLHCTSTNEQGAVEMVRKLCDVDSRSQILADNKVWPQLVSAFRAWQITPEVVGG
jgi:hypothetical protein